MPTVNGDVEIKAGSEDYIDLQLLQDDGVTPVDLSAATSVELRLRNTADQVIKTFATIDASPKLFIIDAAQGKIQLRQKAVDFPGAAIFEYYIVINDAIGAHPVPDGDKLYSLRVVAKF